MKLYRICSRLYRVLENGVVEVCSGNGWHVSSVFKDELSLIENGAEQL